MLIVAVPGRLSAAAMSAQDLASSGNREQYM